MGIDNSVTTSNSLDPDRCKICGSSRFIRIDNTARCRDCHVLMYYPYPVADKLLADADSISTNTDWYQQTARYNHDNFTRMFRFAASEFEFGAELDVLDYGGGGGQFVTVVRSHLPRARVHLVDINDDAGVPGWEELNRRIGFLGFEPDSTKFDIIFLNDVYEHLLDPIGVLSLLRTKLKPGGKIFIDTPRQFWLYPATKFLAPRIYRKLLRGTVSLMHLQIWSDQALVKSIDSAGLVIVKQEHWNEYTQTPDYYLRNMGITNPLLKLGGRLLFEFGGMLTKNKSIVLVENKR
jgi:2-polyprenyl-3-methyl-5-hydroxy-6-metoxy-1,4-benzoquinol methylase